MTLTDLIAAIRVLILKDSSLANAEVFDVDDDVITVLQPITAKNGEKRVLIL